MFLRTSRKHDAIMVAVDRFNKVAHFIAMMSINFGSEVDQIFIREIMRLHGITKKIILDKDVNFTSMFWKDLFTYMGIKLVLSTDYQP